MNQRNVFSIIAVIALIPALVGCSDHGGSSKKKKKNPATVEFEGLASDQSVGTGEIFRVPYRHGKGSGTLGFYADGDGDLTTTDDQVVIVEGIPLGGREVEWNTAGVPPGSYHIVGRGTAGGAETVSVSTGTISVNGAPIIEIVRPAGDDVASLGNTYRIDVTVNDPDDTALFSVFVDGDGDLGTTDDLYEIARDVSDAGGVLQSFPWDTTGVPLGSYSVVVTASDPMNGIVTVTAEDGLEVVENVAWVEPVRGNQGTQIIDLMVLKDGAALVTGALHDASAEGGVHVARYESDGTLTWATTATGPGNKSGFAVDAFDDGSCVVVGAFTSTLVFGPGESGETTLTSADDYDAFLARHHADGTLDWALSIAGTGLQSGAGVSALSDGSVVWSGTFEGSATFGPGEATETFATSAGSRDAFLARHAADGSLIWVRTFGSTGFDGINGVAEMPDGSLVVSGAFSGTVILGPGEPNETTLVSEGETDILVARYETDGTLRWARRAGGAGGDGARRPALRPDGSFLLCGTFSDRADFDDVTLESAGETDLYVAAFDGDGGVLFARGFGGTGRESAYQVSARANGGFAITGIFRDPFTMGSFPLSSAGEEDLLTAEFDADGTLSWARSDGGPAEDSGFGVGFLPDGSVIVGGRYGYHSASATFGRGEAKETTIPAGGGYGGQGFVVRYNRDGKF